MLKRPLISEKSMKFSNDGLYTFEVALAANKDQIKRLVSEKFSVDVLSVKTIRLPSKRKMQRTRKGYYSSSPLKKALVQVKKGQKIALFETTKEPEVITSETETLKEKKNLKGTKVKVEKTVKKEEKKAEPKKKTAKQKSIEKKKGGK